MSAPPYIDLWLLDFEWPSSTRTDDAPPSWLEAADVARLQRMGHPRRRAEFLLGRRLLRHALRKRFGSASHSWQLHTAEKGRPYLHSDAANEILPTISLSHCRGLIACAVGSPARLGLDAECLGRNADFDALASAVCHPLELAAMPPGDPQAKEENFLHYWTLKEALAKALGVGLALPMKQYAFVNDGLAAAPTAFDSASWAFSRPPYRPDVRLALAWNEPDSAAPAITLYGTGLADLGGE